MCSSRWAGLAVFLLTGAALSAQSHLFIEHEGKGRVVFKVRNGYCYVKDDTGKLISVRAPRSGLAPAAEFLPFFVSIRNIEVKTTYVSLAGGGSDINNEFHFRARFDSGYNLPDAFLVLELMMEKGGKRIFVQDIGDVGPKDPRWVDVVVPLSEQLGSGKFQLHVFTAGAEIFHSEQPWQFREAMLDRMVLKRIAQATDAPPRPFVGPIPEFPAALRKAGAPGTAQVKFHLTRTGVVTEPAVVSATDPAFGESALATIRQWRFLPRVKEGRPVESDATMPFDFVPPAAEKK